MKEELLLVQLTPCSFDRVLLGLSPVVPCRAPSCECLAYCTNWHPVGLIYDYDT